MSDTINGRRGRRSAIAALLAWLWPTALNDATQGRRRGLLATVSAWVWPNGLGGGSPPWGRPKSHGHVLGPDGEVHGFAPWRDTDAPEVCVAETWRAKLRRRKRWVLTVVAGVAIAVPALLGLDDLFTGGRVSLFHADGGAAKGPPAAGGAGPGVGAGAGGALGGVPFGRVVGVPGAQGPGAPDVGDSDPVLVGGPGPDDGLTIFDPEFTPAGFGGGGGPSFVGDGVGGSSGGGGGGGGPGGGTGGGGGGGGGGGTDGGPFPPTDPRVDPVGPNPPTKPPIQPNGPGPGPDDGEPGPRVGGPTIVNKPIVPGGPGGPGGSNPGGGDEITAGVPEPSTWMMMILGFGAIGYVVRRRRIAVSVR